MSRRFAIGVTVLACLALQGRIGQAGEFAKAASGHGHVLGSANWTQFQFDAAHSGFNVHETLLSPQNVADLVREWSAPAPLVSGPPAVAGGTAISVASDGMVYAFDASNGSSLWTAFAQGGSFWSPVVTRRAVYVSTSNLNRVDTIGNLYAFDRSTGDLLWSSGQDIAFGEMAIKDGVIYARSASGCLGAYKAVDGSALWQDCVLSGSPAVARDTVFVRIGDFDMGAFDATTGTPRWQVRLNNYVGTAAFAHGRVFVADAAEGLGGYELHVLVAKTGQQLWKWRARAGIPDGLAVAAGVVYVSGGTELNALDASTGSRLWFVTFDDRPSAPIVANGVVYVGVGGAVYGLDATNGDILWRGSTGGSVSAPAVVNGHVYVNAGGSMVSFGLP